MAGVPEKNATAFMPKRRGVSTKIPRRFKYYAAAFSKNAAGFATGRGAGCTPVGRLCSFSLKKG